MTAEVQPRAHRGELAGDGAQRDRAPHAGSAAMTPPSPKAAAVSGPGPGAARRSRAPGGDGRRRREQPRRDGVQQVLAGAEHGRADRHRGRPGSARLGSLGASAGKKSGPVLSWTRVGGFRPCVNVPAACRTRWLARL
jgi:hypothetical protein